MEERRKLERFSLTLPAKLEIISDSPKKPGTSLMAYTSNVSSDGAFFPTLKPLPEGISLRINLVLRGSDNNCPSDIAPFLEITGKVCRSERAGMAVVFDNRYRMISETRI